MRACSSNRPHPRFPPSSPRTPDEAVAAPAAAWPSARAARCLAARGRRRPPRAPACNSWRAPPKRSHHRVLRGPSRKARGRARRRGGSAGPPQRPRRHRPPAAVASPRPSSAGAAAAWSPRGAPAAAVAARQSGGRGAPPPGRPGQLRAPQRSAGPPRPRRGPRAPAPAPRGLLWWSPAVAAAAAAAWGLQWYQFGWAPLLNNEAWIHQLHLWALVCGKPPQQCHPCQVEGGWGWRLELGLGQLQVRWSLVHGWRRLQQHWNPAAARALRSPRKCAAVLTLPSSSVGWAPA
mmetsp:Transcript_86062/g.238443  ORF Transcript_86062/g.238443 Transcript_86062/m.238443 type:complete len:291 (-) Transcript_86062:282-1154(-)